MNQWLVEQAEFRKTKNDKEYLWVQGNTGLRRAPMYVWNTPSSVKPEDLKGKVLEFIQERDMGDYMSMSWKDAVLLNVDELEDNHPIRKVKLKGDVDSKTLIERVQFMADKLNLSKFYREFLQWEEVVEILKKYETVPAGAKVHHPWENGLSTHTEEALTAYTQLSRAYFLKNIKHHVAFVALLFHDYGKLLEYKQPNWEYTENMPLLGHIYLGAKRVEELLDRFYDLYTREGNRDYEPAEYGKDCRLIQHAILAHHGEKEYGSPVTPATIEAYLVHVCDLISARANMWDMSMNMEKNHWLGTIVVK